MNLLAVSEPQKLRQTLGHPITMGTGFITFHGFVQLAGSIIQFVDFGQQRVPQLLQSLVLLDEKGVRVITISHAR